MYDEKTGLPVLDRRGKPETRLLNCGAEFLAPCRDMSRGCFKGTPEKPNTLTKQNQRCYRHYLECRAVGVFPDDPIVKRNAAAIREVVDEVESLNEQEFRESLLSICGLKHG